MNTFLQNIPDWGAAKKIFFRFWFLYFATYVLLNPNNEIPIINTVYEWINTCLHQFIPWFAKYVLHIQTVITVFTNGSGDTTYNYVLWLFGLLISITGCMLWTVLDRKRNNYQTLLYWLTIILRYYLFYTMMTYGLVKVFKVQFPFPYLSRLVQPYGDSSPMGLAWTYIGYSASYNYFAGITELLGGSLLLFRRTTVLGALVSFAVMTNIFMMNMGYDIPVKLLSFNTILMAAFLLWNNIQNLLKFFLLNRSTIPANLGFAHQKKWIGYVAVSLKWSLILFIVIANIIEVIKVQKKYGDTAPKPSLYGIYNVQYFIRNNDTILPLQTDNSRWKQLVIDWEGLAGVKMMDDSIQYYDFRVDTALKKITINENNDTTHQYNLYFIKTDSATYQFKGALWGDSVKIQLQRFDENKFQLVNRGFHWINEYPYNR